MQTLTIDQIDETLANEINAKAQELGLNQAETVRKILTEVLVYSKIEERRKSLARFCGIWTDEDLVEFNEATKDFGIVDPEDWE